MIRLYGRQNFYEFLNDHSNNVLVNTGEINDAAGDMFGLLLDLMTTGEIGDQTFRTATYVIARMMQIMGSLRDDHKALDEVLDALDQTVTV